uniref:TIR domain-containing protein n=1 Tax=Strigamia maritima TaxID=126957 RepID=T1IV18_STRMM
MSLFISFFILLLNSCSTLSTLPKNCTVFKHTGFSQKITLCIGTSLPSIDLTLLDAETTFNLLIICKEQEKMELDEITDFPNGKLKHLRQLQHLHISYCAFRHIGPRALQGLTNLLIFGIKGYQADRIPPAILDEKLFIATPLLNTCTIKNIGMIPNRLFCNEQHQLIIWNLNLEYNKIQYLNAIGCSENNTCCSTLQVLSLGYNQIRRIVKNQLVFPRLFQLDLTSNDIHHIHIDAFDHLQNVKNLTLKRNKLSQIDGKIFQNNTLLEILDLSFNQLIYLPSNIFHWLKYIEIIQLNNNWLFFNEYSKDIFLGLNALHTLDLSFNQIEFLPFRIFSDLISLKRLSIHHNRIESLPSGIFNSLTSLQSLFLSNNMLQKVTNNNITWQQDLLSYNSNLKKISYNAFQGLSHLIVLDLHRNQLDGIPNLQTLKSLSIVYFEFNNITNITADAFAGLNELTSLSLISNNIKLLTNTTFKHVPNIVSMSLDSNQINYIEEGTFDVFKNLINLTVAKNNISEMKSVFTAVKFGLDLADNKIRVFEFTSINSQLVIIDLDRNKLEIIVEPSISIDHYKLERFLATGNQLETFSAFYFPPSIRFIWLDDNNISRINKFTSKTLPTLKYVNLRNNSLTVISNFDISYAHPGNFKERITPNVFLEGNRITCSCENIWLLAYNSTYRYSVYPRMFIDLFCIPTYSRDKQIFSVLSNQKIQKKQLFCENGEKCLDHCSCFYNKLSENILDCFNVTWKHPLPVLQENYTTIFFDGNTNIESVANKLLMNLQSLYTLYLNNSNLMSIPKDMFRGVPNLKELHLEENNLTKINDDDFQFNSQLEILHLHQNKLEYISPNALRNLSNLKWLTLHKNMLQQPHFWTILPLNLTKISFSKNEFLCDCEYTTNFYQWITTKSDPIKFQDLNDAYCNGTRDQIIHQNNCVKVLRENQNNALIIILAPTVSIFLLFTIVLLLTYFYRLEIKVWFYSRYGELLFYDKDDDNDKLYDAFISYANEDDEWVIEELVHRLNEYRLCIHQRDFPVGGFIAESIALAVENSCRTVIVLTPNFLQSQWCRFEFETAHLLSLENKCKRVVVIVLEQVKSLELDKNLRAYLKTNTYLDINDANFWRKLKNVLPDLKTMQQVQIETSL